MVLRDEVTKEKMKAMGRRLEQVRVIARLTETEAAKITQVAPITYKDWEYGKHPVPVRRIRYLLDVLQLEGIACSVEWVTDGLDEGPSKITRFSVREPHIDKKQYVKPIGLHAETQQIQKELATFYQGYSDAIDLIVSDDGMIPIFCSDDIVAGIKLYGKETKKAIGVPCIVTLNDGKILLRTVQEGSTSGKHTLLCINVNSKQKQIQHEVELVNIAPVLWHRKVK